MTTFFREKSYTRLLKVMRSDFAVLTTHNSFCLFLYDWIESGILYDFSMISQLVNDEVLTLSNFCSSLCSDQCVDLLNV